MMGSKDDANLVDAQIEMGLKDHGRARELPTGYCPACAKWHPFPMHDWPDNFAVPIEGGYDAVGAFGPGDHADGPQQSGVTRRTGEEESDE